MNHLHLKVKGKDISLPKNYCITISIQKIILKIHQILGSREKGHCNFWPCPPKNHWINFETLKHPDRWQGEGWTDSISHDPSGYLQGSNTCTGSRLAFKYKRYRVQCWSTQKLLHRSQHAKNQLNSYTYSAHFRDSWTKWKCPFLTLAAEKSVKQLLAFLNLHQHAKRTVHSINSFMRYSSFKSPVTHLILTISTQTFFDQLLIYVNLYQHAKNQAIKNWFVQGKWLIKKSCSLTGWEHFDPYLRNQNFTKTWDFCRNTENNLNFHYGTNLVKIKDKTFP